MHRDNDAWLNLADNLGSLRCIKDMLPTDGNQQDISIGNFFELLFLQCMAQVSQVADHEVIHMNDIDGIASEFDAAFVIMIGSNAGNQDITDLIFAGTAHHTRITSNALGKVVSGMIMADGNDGGI